MDWSPQTIGYIFLFVVFIPAVLGGLVARKKHDYFARGLCISLMSSWFGPLFMYLAPDSRAREGVTEDKESWPPNGAMASLSFLGACLVLYIIL